MIESEVIEMMQLEKLNDLRMMNNNWLSEKFQRERNCWKNPRDDVREVDHVLNYQHQMRENNGRYERRYVDDTLKEFVNIR